MKRKLYILGNGFDRMHCLPTNWSDYHQYMEENCKELYEFFLNYFNFQYNENWLWTNFEKDLSTYYSESFYDDNCPFSKEEWLNQDSPQWSDYFAVEDEINNTLETHIENFKESLNNWLGDIETIKEVKSKAIFNDMKLSLFLTFNYTSTLERVYNISPDDILHIHGYITKNEDLIIGHRETRDIPEEVDENGDSNRGPDSDARSAAGSFFWVYRKSIEDIIEKNKSFFTSLKNIEEVVIIGHSYNDIDFEYFRKIRYCVKDNAKWVFYYYTRQDLENAKKYYSDLQVKNFLTLCSAEQSLTGNLSNP